MEGKKILHVDRNAYYGGACASLSLLQIFERAECQMPLDFAGCFGGRERDYYFDMVTRYLEFKSVSGSYVYRDGSVYKVPSTEYEAITSSLFGFFEKRKAQKFFEYIRSYEQSHPETHQGLDLSLTTMKQVYSKFGLSEGAQDFIGHALAMHPDDSYTDHPAHATHKAILLYMTSMSRFGGSPYIYPLYGLGELPQAFARLSAVHGGTYMLRTPISDLVYKEGRACGVTTDLGDRISCRLGVIGDPSYFPSLVEKKGRIVRAICLLKGPIPSLPYSDGSVQIVIPQRQVLRKYDIYIAAVSSQHQVCPDPYVIAYVSSMLENPDTPTPENEILPGLQLLGAILQKFVFVSDVLVPMGSGTDNQVYISKSYDASSHFESVCDDVLDMYHRVTGKVFAIEHTN